MQNKAFTLYFVTSNKNKVREANIILSVPVASASLEIDEIQSFSSETIIQHKAEEAFKKIKKPLFVEDVSLEISAWNKFPGPFIKYLETIVGYEKVLHMLKDEEDRGVVARCTIGYHDGKNIHIFTGEEAGTIALETRGTKGWGFDVIFIPEGYTQTFAEMGPEEKSKVSHRKKALEKFKEFLRKD